MVESSDREISSRRALSGAALAIVERIGGEIAHEESGDPEDAEMRVHRRVVCGPFLPAIPPSAIRPLPDGSVFGTHIPNDFTPLASGVANG